MDVKRIRDMALSVVKEIEHSSEQIGGEWATWPLAEQVNRLIDAAADSLPEELRPLLPTKFKQSMRAGVAVARYVDVAIAASQVAALLQPEEAK